MGRAMMKKILILLLLGILCGGAAADERLVRMTSLSWPPYADPDLPGGGATVSIARRAFAEMGYRLEVDFYPWSRAIYLARQPTSGYAGYLPEYFSPALSDTFLFSDAAGEGQLGFVQQAGEPLPWQYIGDLRDYHIGVVKDYVNTADLDRMIDDGLLVSSEVLNDKANIQKVAFGRVDLAVIDRHVLSYSLSRDPELAAIAEQVRFHPRLLENKQLFLCFQKDREQLLQIFNEGLSRLNVPQLQADYFRRMLHEPE